MKLNKIELLAPAGSWEALEAAVNAGADAVYMGGTAFGARQYASNFGRDELEQAVRFAHLHKVRIYITVNTLIDDAEVAELTDYLGFLAKIDVDGIIVQDLGVIRIAQKVAPNLALHASTQMTITNSEGAEFAYQAGMERVVLARECSLEDIKKICHGTKAEIEVFVHGALCVCYSGQCLMSSLIGGRSGNRGRCAQPCRLPYDLVNEQGEKLLSANEAGQYLLSPRDMNTLEILPELIQTGVASLKIEGRMKRPEYVAVVVDIYRRAIDGYYAGNYHVPEQDYLNIRQIFNRDFTTGFLEGNPGKEMMSDRRPNNRGVLIGRVINLDFRRNKGIVKLDNRINLGDEVEFWITVGGRTQLTVNSLCKNGVEVATAEIGDQVEIDIPKGVKMHDRIFRVLDKQLMDYAHTFCGDTGKRRIQVTAKVEVSKGEPLVITLTDEEGNSGYGATEFLAEEARKHSLDQAGLRKQLERLGTTEYVLQNLIFDNDENLMVPISEINEARRKAVNSLDEERLNAFRRQPPQLMKRKLEKKETKLSSKHGQIAVQVGTVEQANLAAQAGADIIIVGGEDFGHRSFSLNDGKQVAEITKQYGAQFVISTPRVIKEYQLKKFSEWLQNMDSLNPEYFLVANNSLWEMAGTLSLKTPMWADWPLNIFNAQTQSFWREQGAVGITLSPELTMQQVEQFAIKTDLPLECLVQGRLEMMVTEYCLPGSFLGDLQKGKCSSMCQQTLYLQDRKAEMFPIVTDQYCRMHILNAHELSMLKYVQQMKNIGISRLRIDARFYEGKEITNMVNLYKKVLQENLQVDENLPETTRGHYFRGVL